MNELAETTVTDTVTGTQPSAKLARARAIVCLVCGAGYVLAGMRMASQAGPWTNDVVSGLLIAGSGAVLLPPVLTSLRTRAPWMRAVWAPVALAVAAPILAMSIGSAFAPSAASQERLKAAAIHDAKVLAASGNVDGAEQALSRFEDRRTTDPQLAEMYKQIDVTRQAMIPATTAAPPPSTPPAVEQPKQIPSTPATKPEVVDAEGQALLTTIKALQDQMNDPTSLLITGDKVLKATDPDGKPILQSYVIYRGSNAYGGTVTEKAVVTLSRDGKDVVSIVKFDG